MSPFARPTHGRPIRAHALIIIEISMHQKIAERVVDLDPQETREWMEALDQVLDEAGPDRATYLLDQLNKRATAAGAELPVHLNTPYINSIQAEAEVPYPGDRAMERSEERRVGKECR